MNTLMKTLCAAALLVASAAGTARAADVDSRVTHGYADSNGVKIHYATMGAGPLVYPGREAASVAAVAAALTA